MPPRVSVVIPAYNSERYLSEAIESVLNQEHSIEVLVVDDGSKDSTSKVARSFGPPVTYLHQENAGIGAARNFGVREAQGEILTFLDSDDLWTTGRLKLAIEVLETSDVDMVFGQCEHFLSPDLDSELAAKLRCPEGMAPAFLAGGLVLRREAFSRVGPFSEELRAGEFMNWLVRARALGLTEEIPDELVLRRRLHSSNHGILEKDSYSGDYLRLVREKLRRQRAKDSK